MGAKPKAVGPTSSETAAAAVAQSSFRRWKDKYSPLLVERGITTQTDSVEKTVSGRANAKVMQALANKPTLAETESVDPTGELAAAQQGQQAAAKATALGVRNTEGAGVLSRAQGLAGTATEGLTMAAKLGSAEALNRAANKQAERQSALNAAVKVASSFAGQAYENASKAGSGTENGKIGTYNWSKAFTPQGQDAGTWDDGRAKYSDRTPWEGLWSAFADRGRGK